MWQKRFYYIANWKMQKSFDEAVKWVNQHKAELEKLGSAHSVVICPSFISLVPLVSLLPTEVGVGAQNCSSHESGPFTGEVSARSLYEVGCRYCIIGHSERRSNYCETDETIAAKLQQTLEHDLFPIVCIGETEEELCAGEREMVLTQQLALILQEAARWRGKTILIAYEPIWAIGSGVTPDIQTLTEIFEMLHQLVDEHAAGYHWAFLYGGSVSESNAADLKRIEWLDGFLIGKASLDFQELKKIVS